MFNCGSTLLWLCDVVVGDGGCLQRVSLELLDSGVSDSQLHVECLIFKIRLRRRRLYTHVHQMKNHIYSNRYTMEVERV